MLETRHEHLPTSQLPVEIVPSRRPVRCRSSERLAHPGQRRGKVRFPRLATVFGKGLLEVMRALLDVGPDESDQYRPALEQFLIVELAAPVREFPDGRLTQCTVVAIGEINAPLAGLRVIEKECEALEVSGRTARLNFFELGATPPDRPYGDGAFHLHPAPGPRQGVLETTDVRLPGPQ